MIISAPIRQNYLVSRNWTEFRRCAIRQKSVFEKGNEIPHVFTYSIPNRQGRSRKIFRIVAIAHRYLFLLIITNNNYDGVGDLVYIDCQIDSMCAFMSESWLNSIGVLESDTPFLTLADSGCPAVDLGTLRGMGDEHFWQWCSKVAEEDDEHHHVGDFTHYDCGTQTSVN